MTQTREDGTQWSRRRFATAVGAGVAGLGGLAAAVYHYLSPGQIPVWTITDFTDEHGWVQDVDIMHSPSPANPDSIRFVFTTGQITDDEQRPGAAVFSGPDVTEILGPFSPFDGLKDQFLTGSFTPEAATYKILWKRPTKDGPEVVATTQWTLEQDGTMNL